MNLLFLNYVIGVLSEAKTEEGNELGTKSVVLGHLEIESLDFNTVTG